MLLQQYEFVKNSRSVLLDFCTKISLQDFLTTDSTFGRGSIRNLLTHIANVYEFWIVRNVYKKSIEIRSFNEVENIAQVGEYFELINQTVYNFIEEFKNKLNESIYINLGEREIATTPFQIFTHIITHEFHHKGQILSLSRHLGYTPIDTDIIR